MGTTLATKSSSMRYRGSRVASAGGMLLSGGSIGGPGRQASVVNAAAPNSVDEGYSKRNMIHIPPESWAVERLCRANRFQ